MSYRILIADDNPVVLKTLRQFLEAAGAYEVSQVPDGRQAVSSALALPPDLVILDLAMPVVDGLAAARAILKALPAMPILLYTLHWSPYLEMEAKAAGIQAVIAKSESRALLDAIRQLMSASPSVAAPDPALAPLLLPTHRAIQPAPLDAESSVPQKQAAPSAAEESTPPKPSPLRRSG